MIRRVHVLAGLCLTWAAAGLTACGEEEGIDPPEPLFQEPTIQYPLSLWDAGVEGDVLLRVLVNEVGEVDSVEVLEPSDHPGFDQAAVKGARDLRFRPARRGDRRITAWAQVPVRFVRKPRPGAEP